MIPHYIYDPTVTESLDRELRELLSLCFKDHTFSYQRFNYELPQHRWILRDTNERLVGHVAVHDKRLKTGNHEFRVAGVAEVCVHPDFRKKGYAACLMEVAHAWCGEQGMLYSTLFGLSEIYGKFGYKHQTNLLHRFDVESAVWKTEPHDYFQVLRLSDQIWPEGTIDLQGPKY